MEFSENNSGDSTTTLASTSSDFVPIDQFATGFTTCASLLVIVVNTVFAVNIVRLWNNLRRRSNFLLRLVFSCSIDVISGLSLLTMSAVALDTTTAHHHCAYVIGLFASSKLMSQVSVLFICIQQNIGVRKISIVRLVDESRTLRPVVLQSVLIITLGVVVFFFTGVRGYRSIPLSKQAAVVCHVSFLLKDAGQPTLLAIFVIIAILTLAYNFVYLSTISLLKKDAVNAVSQLGMPKPGDRFFGSESAHRDANDVISNKDNRRAESIQSNERSISLVVSEVFAKTNPRDTSQPYDIGRKISQLADFANKNECIDHINVKPDNFKIKAPNQNYSIDQTQGSSRKKGSSDSSSCPEDSPAVGIVYGNTHYLSRRISLAERVYRSSKCKKKMNYGRQNMFDGQQRNSKSNDKDGIILEPSSLTTRQDSGKNSVQNTNTFNNETAEKHTFNTVRSHKRVVRPHRSDTGSSSSGIIYENIWNTNNGNSITKTIVEEEMEVGISPLNQHSPTGGTTQLQSNHEGTSTSTGCSGVASNNTRTSRKNGKRQHRGLITSVLILISLNIAMVPLLVQTALNLFQLVSVSAETQWYVLLITYVNSVFNPIAYTVSMKHLRNLIAGDVEKIGDCFRNIARQRVLPT